MYKQFVTRISVGYIFCCHVTMRLRGREAWGRSKYIHSALLQTGLFSLDSLPELDPTQGIIF